jgi:hypothetical protein
VSAAVSISKRRAVEPATTIDAARLRLTEAENVARTAAADLAKAKAEEASAIESFVLDTARGPARVAARDVRERAELVLSRAQQTAADARKALDQLTRAQSEKDYEVAIVHATTGIGARLAGPFARLIAIEREVRAIVEGDIADAILSQQEAVATAEALAAILSPAVPLPARGVSRLSIDDARFLYQVALAHQRSSEGADDLVDQWGTTAARIPAWNDPGRDAFVRACSLLGLTPKEKTP